MRHLFRAVATFGFLAIAAIAQQPAREKVAGRVIDSEGQPWARASVTLLHVPHPDLTEPQFADRVDVVADDGGRFSAALLAGMRYVAWASAPLDDGGYRCTGVADLVCGGSAVELRETGRHWRRRLRPDVHANWREPLRFAARCRVGPFLLQQELPVTDGLLHLPAWPVDGVDVLAFAGEFAVFTAKAALCEAGAGGPAAAERLAAVTALKIGAPTGHAVRFVDEHGQPVADVTLVDDTEQTGVPIARADERGVAVVRCAGSAQPPFQSLAAGARCAERMVDGRTFREVTAGAPNDVVLHSAEPVRVRVSNGAGKPAVGLPIVVARDVVMDGDSQWAAAPRLVRTGGDGSFVLPGSERPRAFVSMAVLTPQMRAALGGPANAPPLAPLALLHAPSTATAVEVRLDELRALHVKAKPPKGMPSSPMHLLLVPVPAGDQGAPGSGPLVTATDRLGRVRILAPAESDLLVWAIGDSGAALLRTKNDGRPKELTLDPGYVLSLRVVDSDGKAMSGVKVYAGILHAEPPDPAERLALAVARGLPVLRETTAADGTIDLILPVRRAALDVQLTNSAGQRTEIAMFFGDEPGVRHDVVFPR